MFLLFPAIKHIGSCIINITHHGAILQFKNLTLCPGKSCGAVNFYSHGCPNGKGGPSCAAGMLPIMRVMSSRSGSFKELLVL